MVLNVIPRLLPPSKYVTREKPNSSIFFLVNSDLTFKWLSRLTQYDPLFSDPMLRALNLTRSTRSFTSCNAHCFSTKVPTVLDEVELRRISERLQNVPNLKFNYIDFPKDAAVLMPLCTTVDGKPSVLFTIRAQNMRAHKGEIR